MHFATLEANVQQDVGEVSVRVVDDKVARGSLRWIREAVNLRQSALNAALRQACRFRRKTTIEWMSPLERDQYAEYRDEDFLRLVGVELPKYPLASFWPARGPQWDGLARRGDGRVLLVEAKANIPELVSSGTAATGRSRTRIEAELDETKAFLGVANDIPWSGKLYQYANRLAHLYLLRILNGVDAYLVFLYFTGASDVDGPATVAEWKAAQTVAKKVLGLPQRHELSRYAVDIYFDVANAGHAS